MNETLEPPTTLEKIIFRLDDIDVVANGIQFDLIVPPPDRHKIINQMDKIQKITSVIRELMDDLEDMP